MTKFMPEGSLINTASNRASFKSFSAMEEAMRSGKILEARAMLCTTGHDLVLDLGEIKGIIPREEGAIGMDTGETRDIAVISKVNKPVCFVITGFKTEADGSRTAVCSRKAVQKNCKKEYLDKLIPGDVIPATVTRLESFGCFVDIGCGISSLLPIDSMSVSRISHPKDRFSVGENIFVVVTGRDYGGRICLSHKELLGTWEENAENFAPGETVSGIIRSVEDYGVFVELAPNIAGLAEPFPFVHAGEFASVYIKSLIPEKMKIKLIIVDAFEGDMKPAPLCYYITEGHIDRWQYSPECCRKNIMTDFSGE